MSKLCVRWTIGDASSRGWESLRLSIHCALRLFGAGARYVVCVNSTTLASAQGRAGALPACVEWQALTPARIPEFLRPHFSPEMAEGVGWKLVPPRLCADNDERHELAIDNDCVLYDLPSALREFLASDHATLMAEDVERCLGQFSAVAPAGAFNSGLRGLPPGFDYSEALAATLREAQNASGKPLRLHSELDEQGLQAAALHRERRCLLVSRQEVSICSPFWPRDPEPGSCGAHFVGLNPRHLPWNYYDRSADHVRREHWDRWRPLLYSKAGLPMPPALPLDVE